MATPCDTHIVPIFQTDPCNGETKPAQCIIDSSLYSELGLEANSNQQQINQAMYTAFVNLNSKLNLLQIQVDDLQIQINNIP